MSDDFFKSMQLLVPRGRRNGCLKMTTAMEILKYCQFI